MARKEDVPNLEDALEKGFAELKVGEENIVIDDKISVNDKDPIEPKYGLKIESVESRQKFISKPIQATKKTVEKPIDAKPIDVVKDEVDENLDGQKVVSSPSSKIGDDFDVGW